MQDNIESVSDFFICYKKSVWEKDVDGLVNLYHEQVLVFDMWGAQGFTSGLNDWYLIIKNWLTSLKDEKVNVTFDMIDIHENEKIAFASALIGYEAISMEQVILRSMKNRISLGFEKTGGIWKVKHQHTSAPLDSSFQAIFDI